MQKKFWIALPYYNAVTDTGGGGVDGDPIGDAITSSIADAGGIDHSDGGGADPAAPAPKAQADPAIDPAEEAELATLEKEILAKNPSMQNGKIAVHRHQAVLTRQRNAAEKERAEWQKAKGEYDKQVAEAKRYEWAKDPQLHGALQALALAESDQKGFVDYLMQDPRFAALIDVKQPSQPQAEKAPGPDQKDAEGNAYWSQEGLDKRFEWERKQAAAEAKKGLEAQQREFEQRHKPVVEEFEARNNWNRALGEQRTVLDAAREKWDGFKEYEGQIKKALIEHEEWDLKDAYIMTVPQLRQSQFKTDREKTRQEIITEMNAKPGAVQRVKPGAAIPERESDPNADVDIADVIRASMARSAR